MRSQAKAVGEHEQEVIRLDQTLNDLKGRRIGVEEAASAAAAAHRRLLGSAELGEAVSEAALKAARRDRDAAADQLAGISEAAGEIERRLETARRDLRAAQAAVARSHALEALKAAEGCLAEIIEGYRGLESLVVRLRTELSAAREAAAAHVELVGHAPGDWPDLHSTFVRAGLLTATGGQADSPLILALRACNELRSQWGVWGRGSAE